MCNPTYAGCMSRRRRDRKAANKVTGEFGFRVRAYDPVTGAEAKWWLYSDDGVTLKNELPPNLRPRVFAAGLPGVQPPAQHPCPLLRQFPPPAPFS